VLREGYIGHYQQTEQNDLSLPGPRSYDGRYTELDVTWRGDRFNVQSATKEDDLLILVSPAGERASGPVMAIEGALRWNREGTLSRGGNTLVARCPGREFRVHATAQTVEACGYRKPHPAEIASGFRSILDKTDAHSVRTGPTHGPDTSS
jgi:hypothetical protein